MAEAAPRSSGLTVRIILGMAAGLVVGLAFNLLGADGFLRAYVVDGALHVGGAVFLASLKLLVVPLVFVSLVCGTAALDDVTKLGRVGGRTLGLYLATTAIAISLAIVAAVIVQPGAGFDLPAGGVDFIARESPPFTQTLINLFP